MSSDGLNAIALISGGKDSFFSVLHCLQQGHRVVALANLFPGTTAINSTTTSSAVSQTSPLSGPAERECASSSLPAGLQIVNPSTWIPGSAHSPDHVSSAAGTDRGGVGDDDDDDDDDDEDGDGVDASGRGVRPVDLNSFMYQTVGHEVLPLYAAATGLPLYRLPIDGRAVRHERDYDASGAQACHDETESMVPLLRAIMSRHPEANAVSAGAILSTYQRTRVESIALRLGLTPLAYLWQYPVLPLPGNTIASASTDTPGAASAPAQETQLLSDMASAGLEARIVKVASAGLDESHLWECVSSDEGARRVRSALRKFGSSQGAAALGEGGEFETIVLDGPANLFRRRISVPSRGRKVVREGGGSSWLLLADASVQDKADAAQEPSIRIPEMLDTRFHAILDAVPASALAAQGPATPAESSSVKELPVRRGGTGSFANRSSQGVLRWSVLADAAAAAAADARSIQEETSQIVEKIRLIASEASVDLSQVSNTVIVLRRMSDFPKVNAEYGKLFVKPNPPSRVTISCGDLLPAGSNIAVYLTAPSAGVAADRDGLHVQSRSYWAPANIGPYSQAIDTRVVVQNEQAGFRTISIAGQIPLIPATMVLPEQSDKSHELQVILSLQHLWRVAREVKVQCWTSAVAYFPRSASHIDMERNARVAGYAWREAHGSPDDEDDSADEPDPWDRKYNPAYTSLSGNAEQSAEHSVPSWSVFTLRQQNEPQTCIPPVFAVEVEELPRQAAVEWHAHNGLSQVADSNLETAFYPEVGMAGWQAWHSVVRSSSAVVVYTAVSCAAEHGPKSPEMGDLVKTMEESYKASLLRIGFEEKQCETQRPYLIYVDALEVGRPWSLSEGSSDGLAVVPCRSIWSSSGERLRVVAMFETGFLS